MHYLRHGLLLISLSACGPGTGSEASQSEGSTAPATDTGSSEGSSGPAPTGTTDEPATDTGGTIGATGSDTGETTGVPTTGGTGDTGDTSSSTGDDGGSDSGTTGDEVLNLDPASLSTFELPIGSLRYAVAGHDPAHGLCVSIIFTNASIDGAEHCDGDFEPGVPYVHIEPGAGPCMNWDYAGNVELTAQTGCMRLVSEQPAQIDLDMVFTVDGDLFTGEIHVASP